MSRINIRKSPSKAPEASPEAPKRNRRQIMQGLLSGALVASAGAMVVHKHWDDIIDLLPKDDVKIDNSRPTIMFVVSVADPKLRLGQARASRSQFVRTICDNAGVEYRRYSTDADLSLEEDYIREMHRIGISNGAPCMVLVDKDHVVTVMPIPGTIKEAIEIAREFCDV